MYVQYKYKYESYVEVRKPEGGGRTLRSASD